MKTRLFTVAVAWALTSALAPAHALAGERVHTIVDDGWATPQGHRFSGRVTEAHASADEDAGKRRSLYRNARLLLAHGKEGRVSWSVGPWRWESRADDHGYWELRANGALPALPPGWHEITSQPAASSAAGLLVHDPRNTVGLISDIDDTIVVSEVNHTRRLLRNSLLRSADKRQAVPGMAALYRQLLARNVNPGAAPVFYVSATPRQLTDNVRRFLALNQFPRGVLQLKEVDTESGEPLTDQKAYKLQRITAILQAFPEVKFTLLGDDGELDPETFAELQARHPQQISGVWIRRVHPDPQRRRIAGQGDMADLLQRGANALH